MDTSIVLEGKYRLLEEIGRGAMGTVFLADDMSLKRNVAVKFLLPALSDFPECAERFRNEAIGMAAVRDNNVAQIYSYGKHGNNPYFVMEYLDGLTAENLVDAHNKRGFFIPLDEVLDILIQAVSGLVAIHRAGVIHRDIKPANIMLSGDPMRAVIMDFGLVRNVQVKDQVRVLAGTPAYIAPELVEGKPDAERSMQTDIYSMGTAAYEILTGALPFDGSSWVEILQKHISEIPLFPSERRPGIPEAFDHIILRAMSKPSAERYSSAKELLDELLTLEDIIQIEEAKVPSNTPKRKSIVPRVSPRKSRSVPPIDHRATPTLGRGRLLVADGNPAFRSFVHRIAKAAVPGCRIQSAADGQVALRLAVEFRPTVAVIDLSLPEINGFELVATLRGDPLYRGLGIVVVAERGGHRDADLLSELGVFHFLTKPVDGNTLADVLRPMLERHISPYKSKPPDDIC